MTDISKRIDRFLNYLLVFLLPTQLAFHFWPKNSLFFGIRVDFLAPAIYLTDVLFLLVFVFWAKNNFKKIFQFFKKYRIILTVLLIAAVINISFSISPGVSLFKWIKVLELIAVCFYVAKRPEIFSSKQFLRLLFWSIVVFSLIGILQFFKGGTISSLLYIVGERSFTINTPGIALVHLFNKFYLRAYSTFSHPNSFAGYLGGVMLLTFPLLKNKELIIKLGLIIMLLCFVLTFSLSAFLGLFVSLILLVIVKRRILRKEHANIIVIFTILSSLAFSIASPEIKQIPYLARENILERLDMAEISFNAISNHLITGTGLNTFILYGVMGNLNGQYLWRLQPVHNIFLLVFSETGAIGIIIFYYVLTIVLNSAFKKGQKIYLAFIIFIFITGFFDHYWLTLQQNQLLLAIVFGKILGEKSKNYATLVA